MELHRSTFSLQVSLFVLLILVSAAVIFAVTHRPAPSAPPAQLEENLPLSSTEEAAPSPLRFRDIPSWLFVHVGIIAGAQLLALIAAASKAERRPLSNADARTIQFLVEIPMYLGLFGTLLGVCLTQFVTGTLVAPLAYLTTMSGILLHVFGKLTIWLPIASDKHFED